MYVKKYGCQSLESSFACAIEDCNDWDPYAVAMHASSRLKLGTVIGHVQCRISAACNLFLEQGDKIL